MSDKLKDPEMYFFECLSSDGKLISIYEQNRMILNKLDNLSENARRDVTIKERK